MRLDRRRAALNLVVITTILFSVVWIEGNVPARLLTVGVLDVSLCVLMPCMLVAFFGMAGLAYSRATWHLGAPKRVLVRGQLIFMIGAACWMMDEGGVLTCPVIFSLHPVWHVCVAHTLLAW
jgi:hypothetical protein